MEVFITQLVAYISQLPGYLWQLIQYFFATEHFFESLYYLSAFAGVILLYLQWPEANKTKRTELIEGILQQFRFDPEFSLTLNLIDYGQFHYNAEFHGSALRAKDPKESLEFKIDRLLSYMDYICYLHQGKTITDDEFYIVKYEILRACESISVQRYLWNLYHFSHDRAMGRHLSLFNQFYVK